MALEQIYLYSFWDAKFPAMRKRRTKNQLITIYKFTVDNECEQFRFGLDFRNNKIIICRAFATTQFTPLFLLFMRIMRTTINEKQIENHSMWKSTLAKCWNYTV